MMGRRTFICVLPVIVTLYAPARATVVQPPISSNTEQISALWEQPDDLQNRDLFNGPWGAERAPDPQVTYTFIRAKEHGVNPGVVVRDPLGREWHVKQPPHNHNGAEGPVEVVLSRVLSAVGYHQPPVYFLPSFTMKDASGTHRAPGGRFRLHDKSLKNLGIWSWQQNPFVGTRPYHGLLVILLMFNSWDLKNSNNTLYELRRADGRVEQWYVVRDLGGALGETGRVAPRRGDPDLFERLQFINGVKDGFVEFNYHGKRQELIRGRIAPDDVGWAGDLMARLSQRQWQDAFRAGGYTPDVADRFIRKLRANIAQGQQVVAADRRRASQRQ
jgi:hypothetical protein